MKVLRLKRWPAQTHCEDGQGLRSGSCNRGHDGHSMERKQAVLHLPVNFGAQCAYGVPCLLPVCSAAGAAALHVQYTALQPNELAAHCQNGTFPAQGICVRC